MLNRLKRLRRVSRYHDRLVDDLFFYLMTYHHTDRDPLHRGHATDECCNTFCADTVAMLRKAAPEAALWR